jgi:hypothetical protein
MYVFVSRPDPDVQPPRAVSPVHRGHSFSPRRPAFRHSTKAEKIGAETVTCVGNISKYYIAYHLIMEARAERERAAEKMKGQRK